MRGSPFSFTNFSRGLNAIDSPYTLQEGETRECLNVVSSPRGAIKKRNGCVSFVSATQGIMPTLAATDNFNRANENPLSNAGKWTVITGFSNTGKVETNAWVGTFGGSGAGAYWNVAEQTNPAVSVEYRGGKLGNRVWACVQAGAQSGYAFSASENEITHEATLTLEKWAAGVSTVLATTSGPKLEVGDIFGITVRAGVVTAWRFRNGAWEQVRSARDSTYTKGFCGISASGSITTFDNFAFGEAPTAATENEFTSLGSCVIAGVPYLIGVAGKKIYSITESGELNDITGAATVTEGVRWSIIQSTSGAPNRVTADGPVYLSNGTDLPLYWTGATKTTAVAEWTANPVGTFQAVPKAKFLTYLGNRVWAAGITGDTSALRWSGFAVKTEEGEQADPTSWPKAQVNWFEKEDGTPITGIGIAGAYLMVFKRHKTWAVFDLNEGENRRVSDSIGCIAYRSIVETPMGTFFLTPDQGVYSTNGSSVREMSRNVRPILQGTDTDITRSAKLDQLESAAAGYLYGHYYLSYMAQDGTMKTLDYDTVLQSWWLHDVAGNQWILWEPKAGSCALYTIPRASRGGVLRAFVEGVYQDKGVNYTGRHGQTAYWLSPWEPFWQYFMRHRFAQPNPKKRIRELFVDGKGELETTVYTGFQQAGTVLKGAVDNADMSTPTSPVTLGGGSLSFPTLSVVDSFVRANENPLTGNWAKVHADTKGRIESGHWENDTAAGLRKESGARRTDNFKVNPAASIEVGLFGATATGNNFFLLTCCTTDENLTGYSLGVQPNAGNTAYTFRIDMWPLGEAKVAKLLQFVEISEAVVAGMQIGITVAGGIVTGWVKMPGGTWTRRLEVADSTYTEGYSAFYTSVFDAVQNGFNNFSVGNAQIASSREYQAVRYWSLGISRVWSFGFGNNSAEPWEVDGFSCHLFFRKS